MIGLFAFFYACLHFLTYLWLDKDFELREMLKDVGKRPFITAGFAAFLLMAPLAVTSTAGWIRRLGGKRWQLLHAWSTSAPPPPWCITTGLVKSDIRLPLLYAALVGLLLAYRLIASRPPPPAPRAAR